MSEALVLEDAASLEDLGSYVGRLRRFDASAAVRLQAMGTTLATWAGVLAGQGLPAKGVVLGLRVSRLREASDCDVVVAASSITERVAHEATTGPERNVLVIPPTHVNAPWLGMTPPRSGWKAVGELPEDVLTRAAQEGIAEVSNGTPPGAGKVAVDDLRAKVWGRHIGGAGDDAVPAGAALAVHVLGFATPGAPVQVARCGPWVRLAAPGGFVLAR